MRRFPLFAVAIFFLAAPRMLVAGEPGVEGVEGGKAEGKTADAAAPDSDEIISLSAYNAKADRIEDFGLRVGSSFYSKPPKTTAGFFLSKFVPAITAVVPNTAAAKAGLRPGDRILKSEGQSTVGGLFSTGKLGKWYKIQKKKWAEVAAGKTNVTWTLEIETPATKAVRTVKLVVPTPAPHWGASVWQKPEGRIPSTVAEPGPLADLSRAVLDNGIPTLLDERFARALGVTFTSEPGPDARLVSGREPIGYEWHVGNRQANRPEGVHRIVVTQFRGRTDVFFETDSPWTGGLYLTSPSGALEHGSGWVQGGAGSPEEIRAGFDYELDFWTTKVERGTGRWPFEVKPGYDAKTMFAGFDPKKLKPAGEVARPASAEFRKLRSATGDERALFSDAYAKLGAEPDRWAYTETARSLEDKRVTVARFDPSRAGAARGVLVSINGKPPTAEEMQGWREAGEDVPKPLGDFPSLAGLVDLQDLRVFKDETAAVVFELPMRSDRAEFPAEKFQALFRVNKTYRSFEDIAVQMRDSFRVAGVVKITGAGLRARFQTLDPARPPQPVSLKGGGAARILLVKISRDFETTRADFERVEPYVEPDPSAPAAMPGPAPLAIPLPEKF